MWWFQNRSQVGVEWSFSLQIYQMRVSFLIYIQNFYLPWKTVFMKTLILSPSKSNIIKAMFVQLMVVAISNIDMIHPWGSVSEFCGLNNKSFIKKHKVRSSAWNYILPIALVSRKISLVPDSIILVMMDSWSLIHLTILLRRSQNISSQLIRLLCLVDTAVFTMTVLSQIIRSVHICFHQPLKLGTR